MMASFVELDKDRIAKQSRLEETMRAGSRNTGQFYSTLECSVSTSSPACEDEWEVYVCHRPLREVTGDLYSTLPPKVKSSLRDLGVCHFMAVFRSRRGELVQFDFGPRGGDMVVTIPASQNRSNLSNVETMVELLHHEKGIIFAGPQGEIREERLDGGLPSTALYMGCTRLSLDAIRSFNNVHNMAYQLNHNDCRHYVDMLVRFTTGIERASASLMRHSVSRRCQQPPALGDRLIQVAQWALEKESTAFLAKGVQTSLTATLVTAVLKFGRAVLPMRRFPLPSILLAATGIVASCAAIDNPLLKEAASFGSQLGNSFRGLADQGAVQHMGLISGVFANSSHERKQECESQADFKRLSIHEQLLLFPKTRRRHSTGQVFNPPALDHSFAQNWGKKLRAAVTCGAQLQSRLSLVSMPRSCRREPFESLALMVSSRF